ncbi:MAG: glutamine--phosphoribosylpyrophosphate amidotransferase [Bacteriovoracaceae bacterium]|nr:glutamine--phosphoribosylpyrophosphate amidotransferase [Bacteriovoracaceae bacterium]
MSGDFKDKCGVFAAWNVPEAAHVTYLGLFALQHRGQEGAGIVASNGGRFQGHRGEGLVYNVFSKATLANLPGDRAIGHVRYSTAGGSLAKNVQPLWVESSLSEVAIAHNGNLTNAVTIRHQLEKKGSVFQTLVDTEVILHLMAVAEGNAAAKLKTALSQVEGAYSLIVMTREANETKVFVVKDPYGFRPLALGRLDGGWVAASESCAFDLVGAEMVRELEPGEVVEFSGNEVKSWFLKEKAKPAPCVFEWIYFSRPDSLVFGESVYEMRKKLGEILAEQDKANGLKADMVIGVPDSGIPAAIGYSQASGIPFEMGLIRNHYIGRTFIEPLQSIRDFSVKIKQNPLRGSLVGKKVVVIDDSVVRGTTSKKINQFLRDAGVAEIHMRISAPPTISPCYYGIDTPQKKELIAANMTVNEIRDFMVADTLTYLNMDLITERLKPKTSMCDACFTGKYPIKPKDIV